MRPGGLGSTQLIQKLAQLAWYWWPPYSSLKLSVSELKACQSGNWYIMVYYILCTGNKETINSSVHTGERGTDREDMDKEGDTVLCLHAPRILKMGTNVHLEHEFSFHIWPLLYISA